MAARQYDLVLFGATGHSGVYAAEHIVQSLPTNLKWALAGRNHAKLSKVLSDIRQLHPDRTQPSIEIAELNKEDLHALAKRSKVLISAVGPYHKYGEPVVEACAANGTHYFDITGECPWVQKMVERYHDLAQRTGAIIVPQCAVESAIGDVMTLWMATNLYQEKAVKTHQIRYGVHTFSGVFSLGTLESLFGIFDAYSVTEIMNSTKPQAICPRELSSSQRSPPSSLLTKLTGVLRVPDLGVLTTTFTGKPDIPIVHRSFGLLTHYDKAKSGSCYGDGFTFQPHDMTRNAFIGLLRHVAAVIIPASFALAPVRWLIKRLARPAAQNLSRDPTGRGIETRCMALPTTDLSKGPKLWGRLRWDGDLYNISGIILVQAAARLIYDNKDDIPAFKMGGGVLTPACLGAGLADRMMSAGCHIEKKLIE